MPMSWDAAADAKLFTVVMAVYDIKISGAQNEKIAKLMGDDVTPKAITHRLSKIKAQAGPISRSGTSGPSTPSSSRKNAKTPTSKASTKGKGGKGFGSGGRDENGLSATHTRTTHMTDDGEDDEEDFSTPTKLAKSTHSNSNFMNAINAVKSESATKKRKIGPKIESFDFEEAEGDGEGNGDAIDFSIGYTGSTVVKMEEGEIVDLTDDIGDGLGDDLGGSTNDTGDKKQSKNGKGKERERVNMGGAGDIFNAKVKKEVIDLGDMGEDEDDEMVV